MYQDKIKHLVISFELNSILKPQAHHVLIESNTIKMSGGVEKIAGGTLHDTGKEHTERVYFMWDVVIPIENIINVYQGTFRARGSMNSCMNRVVGIDANMDGTLLSYGIFTEKADGADNLYRAI